MQKPHREALDLARNRSQAMFGLRELFLLVTSTGASCGVVVQVVAADTPSLPTLVWFLVVWFVSWTMLVVAGIRRQSGVLLRLSAVPLFVLSLAMCSRGFGPLRNRRTGAPQSTCTDNLQQIALACCNYQQTFGCLPPAYFTDKSGRPVHSWRILILPFLGQKPLYNRYDFREPWDGPNNSRLLAEMPDVYRCPSDTAKRSTTSYVAIVGPETAWPGATSVSFSEITDGPANTLLVVESHDASILWMQPADLEFPPLLPRINPQPGPGISSSHPGGAQAAFADGHVQFLSESLAPEEVRALFTFSGGEPQPFFQRR